MNIAYLIALPVFTLAGVLLGAWLTYRIRSGQSPLPQLWKAKDEEQATKDPQPPRVRL
jgi:hypothetical protein